MFFTGSETPKHQGTPIDWPVRSDSGSAGSVTGPTHVLKLSRSTFVDGSDSFVKSLRSWIGGEYRQTNGKTQARRVRLQVLHDGKTNPFALMRWQQTEVFQKNMIGILKRLNIANEFPVRLNDTSVALLPVIRKVLSLPILVPAPYLFNMSAEKLLMKRENGIVIILSGRRDGEMRNHEFAENEAAARSPC